MAAHKRRHYPQSVRPQRLHPDDEYDPNSHQTVGERVVQLLGLGMPLDHAGGAVGLSPPEIRAWLRAGIGVLTQDAAGRDWSSFTYDERALGSFAYAALTAEGDWIARKHAQMERASQAQTVTTTVENYAANGSLLERTVREQVVPGDMKLVTWQLERRFPKVYGPRGGEGTSMGVDTTNEPDTRERLRDRLADIGKRLALPPGGDT